LVHDHSALSAGAFSILRPLSWRARCKRRVRGSAALANAGDGEIAGAADRRHGEYVHHRQQVDMIARLAAVATMPGVA
jgi:hypothetical protein